MGTKGIWQRPAAVSDQQVAENWPRPDPDWRQAPDDYRWFAVDPDGHGYFHAAEPTVTKSVWMTADFKRVVHAGYWPGARLAWRETLQERPE